jgi:uracil DNA glycosylase
VDAVREIQWGWSEFRQESIDRLVASFSNRVQMVWEAEGRAIQSLIYTGKTTAPPWYAMAIRIPQ